MRAILFLIVGAFALVVATSVFVHIYHWTALGIPVEFRSVGMLLLLVILALSYVAILLFEPVNRNPKTPGD